MIEQIQPFNIPQIKDFNCDLESFDDDSSPYSQRVSHPENITSSCDNLSYDISESDPEILDEFSYENPYQKKLIINEYFRKITVDTPLRRAKSQTLISKFFNCI